MALRNGEFARRPDPEVATEKASVKITDALLLCPEVS